MVDRMVSHTEGDCGDRGHVLPRLCKAEFLSWPVDGKMGREEQKVAGRCVNGGVQALKQLLETGKVG